MTFAEPVPGDALVGPAPPRARERTALPFWHLLEQHGGAPAVRTGATVVTYAELAALADELAGRLGTTRRLVLLRAANDLATVVGLLACLRGGHPVLVTDGRGPAAAGLWLVASRATTGVEGALARRSAVRRTAEVGS